MSEPIRDLETAVRELGSLPMPAGPGPDAGERAKVAELIGNAKPASDGLLVQVGQSVRDVREHEHPKWEDLYCLNLVSFMGERMGPVLRRLLNAEARVSDLEAELYTAQAHGRTYLEQRNAHAKELLELRRMAGTAEADAVELPESALEHVQAILLAHFGELPRPDMAVGLLLTNLRAEWEAAPTGGSYPPALPWAQLMDREDLAEFLLELGQAAVGHDDVVQALAEVEKACGTWRLIAEAQHAHNTAPGPDVAEAGDRS